MRTRGPGAPPRREIPGSSFVVIFRAVRLSLGCLASPQLFPGLHSWCPESGFPPRGFRGPFPGEDGEIHAALG